ncbi:MAG TPA: flavodoxin domain-containing protein [Methanoregula sp.]|nr:flavodoxin domain-containing protein [Methanoregula sp.]
MAKILVVYFSRTGNTEKLADSVAEGAREGGAEVMVKKAALVTVDELVVADAIAFGSATSWGYMGGILKDVLENMLIQARDKFGGKPYAVFISAGAIESGRKAAESIGNIAKHFRMRSVANDVVSKGSPSAADREACRESGRKLARAIQ